MHAPPASVALSALSAELALQGRASIQPTRKREAAVPNFEESMPIDDGNNGEMFAPDPVPMDVGTQYIPAQGQV